MLRLRWYRDGLWRDLLRLLRKGCRLLDRLRRNRLCGGCLRRHLGRDHRLLIRPHRRRILSGFSGNRSGCDRILIHGFLFFAISLLIGFRSFRFDDEENNYNSNDQH